MLLLAFFVVCLGAIGYFALFTAPSPEATIRAFQAEGLEVGAYHDLDTDTGFQQSFTPKVYEQGWWFEVPSLTAREGEPSGGKVYTFDSVEDLNAMENYYVQATDMPIFGGALASHLYRDDRRLMLVQIYGQLPKDQADEYERVMNRTLPGGMVF
jgi:hypothetical protein